MSKFLGKNLGVFWSPNKVPNFGTMYSNLMTSLSDLGRPSDLAVDDCRPWPKALQPQSPRDGLDGNGDRNNLGQLEC